MQRLLELFRKPAKYLVAGVILAVPLYPKFPFIRIPGTYVSIRLEDFLIGVVVLATLIIFLPKLKSLLGKAVVKAIFLFLFIGLISLISAIFLTKTVVPHIGVLHLLRRVEYFLPFFVGFLVMGEGRRGLLEFFLKCLMVVILLAFLYGLGQKYLNWPVIMTQNEEYSKGIALRYTPGAHLNSTFAGHYDLATFLVLTLPIFICLFFLMKGLYSKATLLAVILAGLWLLENAISRISIVSYLVGTSMGLAFIKKSKMIPVVFVVSIVFFGSSSDLLARYIRIIQVTYPRLKNIELFYNVRHFEALAQQDTILQRRVETSTPSPIPIPVFEDRSTSIRFNVEWPRAARAFSKNPILGTGFSSITLATDNDYLRLLGEVGILGFLSFILIFLNIGILVRKALPLVDKFRGVELGFISGVIAAIPGVLLNAFFIDVFEASKFAIIFWLLVGVSVSMLRISRNEQTN